MNDDAETSGVDIGARAALRLIHQARYAKRLDFSAGENGGRLGFVLKETGHLRGPDQMGDDCHRARHVLGRQIALIEGGEPRPAPAIPRTTY